MRDADEVVLTSPEGRLEFGMAAAGDLRWVATDVTGPARFIRRRLDLSPVAVAALGRCLAGAAMLLRLAQKTPTRLILEVRGDGPLRKVMGEADQEGNLRGLVGEPRVDVDPYSGGKLAVGRALGSGTLHVLREYERGGRYHSQVRLVSGEIGQDLAHFLDQSEQVRSAVLVGVLTRPQRVAAAGGLIVEVLPGAREESVRRLEQNIAASAEVSRTLESGGLAGLEETVLAGLDPQLRQSQGVRYHCRCSRERFLGHLQGLSAEQLEELGLEEEMAIAECAFCGAAYQFQTSELEPQ
ncbi:MAG TPA: Hsp33 family molecular chaperone HslO [Thermoanaerobaculia bacterium]|nr:Hsp33 family molecular chaperone HslO [Thermoanaerobaculia bacterium]